MGLMIFWCGGMDGFRLVFIILRFEWVLDFFQLCYIFFLVRRFCLLLHSPYFTPPGSLSIVNCIYIYFTPPRPIIINGQLQIIISHPPSSYWSSTSPNSPLLFPSSYWSTKNNLFHTPPSSHWSTANTSISFRHLS